MDQSYAQDKLRCGVMASNKMRLLHQHTDNLHQSGPVLFYKKKEEDVVYVIWLYIDPSNSNTGKTVQSKTGFVLYV
jgi:hypothetical protein